MSYGLERRIQRRLLHEGKLTEAQYRKLRRRVDVTDREDDYNRRRVLWARAARKQLADADWDKGDSPQVRIIRNMLKQCYLLELIYHPTKGFRHRRGEAA